ncbi:D-2-hydroxyacid dehydrogenase family protein [Kineosporia sp. J2-2]|uniref:D-2-hydroxyacid dehydrogenase family protein n=1 Tax=Kineosporia corallincola TaxID=2835133 RepID=A0ABS5TPV5_9ACTN|nr:D-2-hydroxyacid dehydrogenase family protein [Kineosporia corallincola]MBT0773148.1 D-2-hydroxyacid dehydrogenase family protein [Kineosporia corallincola]
MPDITAVAILDDYQDVALTYADWSSLRPTVFREPFADEDAVVAALEPFDVVVAMRERTRFPAGVLRRLPRLRLLVTTGPVNAAIDVPAARELGVTVCGTGGGGRQATIELTWGLILALARHIPQEDRRLRDGGWQRTVGTDLAGRRLGLIGLGGIGSAVARIGLAFGMDVAAWSTNLDAEHARSLGVTPVERDELLTTADIVSVHLRLSERTRGLLGERELALLKPTALVVNTSRGPIIHEAALLKALHESRIGGAALDVYDTEPLPADSPWRSAPRTVLTPHIGYVSENTYRSFYSDALEDILAYSAGSPIRVIGG